jgi:hypothetical protein
MRKGGRTEESNDEFSSTSFASLALRTTGEAYIPQGSSASRSTIKSKARSSGNREEERER